MLLGLAQTQRTFAAAIFDPTLAVPAPLRGCASRRAASAFAVYRNNVAASLINVLRTRFPVIVRLIGDNSFHAIALAFATRHPPRSPVMLGYGEDFPDFLQSLTTTPSAAYLADIARLEVARGRAYHAADAEPVASDCFAALTEAQLPLLTMRLHPSMTLMRSRFPVVSAWEVNQPGSDQLIRCWKAEDAMIARPRQDVKVTRLPQGGFAFLSALARGASLATAIDTGLGDDAEFDLAANFAILAGSGVVVDLPATGF